MTRTRIAESSSDGTPYGHLVPVVQAEEAWGNERTGEWEMHPVDQVWRMRLRRPLHLDRLQAEFEFPPHIRLGRQENGDTYVSDPKELISISGRDPSRPLGPPRKPRTGWLAKVFGP